GVVGGEPWGGRRKAGEVGRRDFEFPRRNLDLLYFPTVHVHDRKIHPDAMFDHTLYCQSEPAMEEYLQGWEKSYGQASAFMDIDRAEGVVAPNHHCWRRPPVGRLENKDPLVGRGGPVPAFSAVCPHRN